MPPTMIGLVDRILDGKLRDTLEGWRAEGLSIAACARRLHADHDIDVTDETVRQWLIELDLDTSRRVAS